MNQTETIKRFLQSREDVDVVQTGFPFVTISREAGAGGHTLGRDIIRELLKSKHPELHSGWELFDQKLCAILAGDPKFHNSFDALVEEKYRSEINHTLLDMFLGHSQAYTQQKKIAEVVRLLGTLGKVVIIGRGGMCITRDMPQAIHMRLVAPEKVRLRNMMEMLETTEKEALKAMHQQDHDRAKMIHDFFNKDINNPLLYDIVWNTGEMHSTEIAIAIAAMLEHRMKKFAPRHA